MVCLLAGDGPLRVKLETQARELGLDGVCRFLGDVSEIETLFEVTRRFGILRRQGGK